MAILSVNEEVDFNNLKELLEITDGNLASHLKALEKSEYIEVRKQFVGRKPQTTYCLTSLGKSSFQEHVDALGKLISST